jgi:hypothetical protein
MYQRARVGFERTLGPDHTSKLKTVSHLGDLYKNKDKPVEAEAMYQKALVGFERALGLDHKLTLETVDAGDGQLPGRPVHVPRQADRGPDDVPESSCRV